MQIRYEIGLANDANDAKSEGSLADRRSSNLIRILIRMNRGKC